MEKPSKFEIGQRYGSSGGFIYEIIGIPKPGDIKVRVENNGQEREFSDDWVRYDTFLGYAKPTEVNSEPTPAAPVEGAPPKHQMKVEGECFHWCAGCRWRTNRGLPTDWEPACPAAPVRKPGELTLDQARDALRRGEAVEVRWGDTPDTHSAWYPLTWSVQASFEDISRASFRLKPVAPPAPKPGKVEEMHDVWHSGGPGSILELCQSVARESLACVRRLAANAYNISAKDLSPVMDAAALELLGDGEVKRGG